MGGTFDEASLVGVSAEYITSVVGKVGALGGGACTLLGPEGPGADRVSFLELVVVGVCSSGPLLCLPVGGCGGGSARTLRTTQWTRASSMQLFGVVW